MYLFQISSLLAPLLQLVKTGFTKVAQRLDGIYALFCVAKIAAIDVKAGFFWISDLNLYVCVYIEYSKSYSYFCDSLSLDETVLKEKIWALISQNEPSLVPITMVSIQQNSLVLF